MRTKCFLGPVLSVLLVCVACSAAAAQIIPSPADDSGLGGNNSITGTVLLSTGGRLERRATIRLQTMTKGDRVASTDENGNFAFRGLVSGDYTLVIDREKDFEPLTQVVRVIQVRGFPGQTYNVSLRLTPKSTALPKPGVVNAAAASLPERGRSLYTKAKELQTSGDHKAAISELITLTTEFPTFVDGFNELGVEYLRTGQLELADAAFQSALKIDPKAFAPMMNRGITLVSLKRFPDAETTLRKAKEIDHESAVVSYFLGQTLANLGRFDEAEKEFIDAVKLGGDEMKEAHRFLAIIYGSRQDTRRELAELETYLRLVPQAPDADQLRALVEKLKQKPAGGQDPSEPKSHPSSIIRHVQVQEFGFKSETS